MESSNNMSVEGTWHILGSNSAAMLHQGFPSLPGFYSYMLANKVRFKKYTHFVNVNGPEVIQSCFKSIQALTK